MRHNIRAALVLTLVIVSSTGARQAPRTAPLGTAFQLRPGESATITGEQLDVRFDRVTGDSRCPRGAQCIRAGDVRIAVTVQKSGGASAILELMTPSPRPAGATYQQYRIELAAVEPVPEVGRQVRPEEYVATLLVRRE
jgi:hypothetical protein